MVVIHPCLIPNFSMITLTTGARQLVVQLAFVIIFFSPLPNNLSLHPSTTFKHAGSFTGAETTTLLTPQESMYGLKVSMVRNFPVHSNTISTPMALKSILV
jgi:hypothetical protein